MNDTITNSRTGATTPATRITCDCSACGGLTILVPTLTLTNPRGGKPFAGKKRDVVVHNLVIGRKIFGYPTV
jgi:hypothetical protein